MRHMPLGLILLAYVAPHYAHAEQAHFMSPADCYSPLLQAKLDFRGLDTYRLAYLSLVTKDNFDTFKATGALSGMIPKTPIGIETSWGVFHDAQVKEMSNTSLNIEQERERALTVLSLDPQAGKVIHDCLTGGLGLTYSYWSTNKSTTILRLSWKGQGAIPLRIIRSHIENANSTGAVQKGVLFDQPFLVKESSTITLKRIDPNEDITVTFDLEPQIQYDPPIISPFPKKQLCKNHTYEKDPETGAPYSFRKSFDVNQEQYLRRSMQSILGTDWLITFTAPPEGMKLFSDDAKVAITSATCDKGQQAYIELVGANHGSSVQANGINTPTVTCEGGKNGSTGEIVLYGTFTVTAKECETVDWEAPYRTVDNASRNRR
jgi:hypothetical protein